MPKNKSSKMFDIHNLHLSGENAPPPTVDPAMPIEISKGLKYSQDYADIPCDSICEFRKKDPYDVINKNDPEFQALVVSIAERGVYDAIIVRPVIDEDLNASGIEYEVMAGHHRLAASIEAGKKTIIAKIDRECSDKEAEDIYRVTNLLRKNQSIREKAYGWWHYFRMTRYKSEEEVAELISQGKISESYNVIRESKGNKQLRRYARLHELTDEMMDLVERKLVSIKFGEQISYIDKSLQNDLLNYKASLKNVNTAVQLRALAEGKIDGQEWSQETIERILFPNPLLSEGRKEAENAIEFVKELREVVPEPYHQQEPMIDLIREALHLYFKTYPEKLQPKV